MRVRFVCFRAVAERLSVLWLVLICLSAVLPSGAAEADSRVIPGKTFYVDFPNLGQTWAKQSARMGIYIPQDYTAEKLFPLLVWFGGGYGSDNPGQAMKIAGDSGYVCVAVPYKFTDEDTEGGWSGTPWSYYKLMLDEMDRIVPNIDKQNRIAGGFSSGGCAVMHKIGNSKGAFQEYFYGFMPGGAGWPMGGLKSIRGRPMLAFIGEKDKRFDNYKMIEKDATAANVDLEFMVFKGVGHSIPASHYPQMREWMLKKVILRDLDKLTATLEKEMKIRHWNSAYRVANRIASITPPEMQEHQDALQKIEQLKPQGEALSKKLLAARPNTTAIQQFVRDWQGCDFTAPVKERGNDIAEQQLAKIMAGKPVSVGYLKKFITMWEGFPACDPALETFNQYAEKSLEKICSSTVKSTKIRALNKFKIDWVPAPAVAKADEVLEEIAKADLEEITKTKSKSMLRSKLKSFIKNYAGTTAEAEAQQLLDQV